jgi:SAM-dependent MidA family methyltransferase
LTNISQKKKDWQTVHKDAGQVHDKFIDNYGNAQLTSVINF